LPAVQAAREAARRIDCRNNCKQIGLALHAYHDVYRQLPAGWIAHPNTGEPGWGWATHILPFLEQINLHAQIQLNLPIADSSNQIVRETSLSVYRCVSDGRGNDPLVLLAEEATGNSLFKVARANYVGAFGTLEIEDDPFAGDGVLFQNSNLRFADVTDGLSNTIFVGERCSRIDGSTWTGAVEDAEEGLVRIVASSDHVPNHPAAHFDDFSSFHPTGAHFTLGDGSVRMLADTIDLDVYRALATRTGDEPIGKID
jgi:hypothetical protein